MAFNVFRKKQPRQPKSWLREWRDSLIFAVTVATLFRWSLVEAFVIPTPSMENSLLVGDYLFVSKIHYGSRTPRTPLQIPLTHQKIWGTEIPSYLDWIQLPSYRLPGLRDVRRGEPVVFNVPKDLLDPTDRPIDLKTYLVKRCVAIHGDKLEIKNKQLYINGVGQENPEGMKFSYLVLARDEINKRHFDTFGMNSNDYSYLGKPNDSTAVYRMLLTTRQAEEFKALPFVREVREIKASQEPSGFPLFPKSMDDRWSKDDYGVLVIPEEGMKMAVNDSTLAVYGEIISKYEGNHHVRIDGGKLIIDGKEVHEYTFRQNYYFMMGDNRDDSLDSRYWGFVPEDHILGRPLFIWFSWDSEATLSRKVRWNRIFSLVR